MRFVAEPVDSKYPNSEWGVVDLDGTNHAFSFFIMRNMNKERAEHEAKILNWKEGQ